MPSPVERDYADNSDARYHRKRYALQHAPEPSPLPVFTIVLAERDRSGAWQYHVPGEAPVPFTSACKRWGEGICRAAERIRLAEGQNYEPLRESIPMVRWHGRTR